MLQCLRRGRTRSDEQSQSFLPRVSPNNGSAALGQNFWSGTAPKSLVQQRLMERYLSGYRIRASHWWVSPADKGSGLADCRTVALIDTPPQGPMRRGGHAGPAGPASPASPASQSKTQIKHLSRLCSLSSHPLTLQHSSTSIAHFAPPAAGSHSHPEAAVFHHRLAVILFLIRSGQLQPLRHASMTTDSSPAITRPTLPLTSAVPAPAATPNQ